MDIYLVQPRGFCAGVRRALEIVDKTLERYGAPVYVRHEIVHNKHIIDNLRQRGVIFIDHLNEISDTSRPVIISAHGAAKSVRREAKRLALNIIDATCPLVEAVHRQIRKLESDGAEIIVIGKASHPEIQGTIGQLKSPQKAHIISSVTEAEQLNFPTDTLLGIVTQTTLAVDIPQQITDCLRKRFTNIINTTQPHVCFATTNRQKAVETLAQKTENIIIIGSQNSSNSTHLKEAALRYGAKQAWLIDDVSGADLSALDNCRSLGISAGASAPEYLVEELVDFLTARYPNVNIHNVIVMEENINFK